MRRGIVTAIEMSLVLTIAIAAVSSGGRPSRAQEPSSSARERDSRINAGGGLEPGQGLSALPVLSSARTRSICAENPTGGKGQGGRALPDPSDPSPPASARAADDLGQGWKVRPFLRVNRGQTATLMDVAGPGIIQHIWMVENLSRAHVLRFYWDGEETPSIEVPCARFFCRRPRDLRACELAGRCGQPAERVELLLADAFPLTCADHAHQRVAD